VERFENHTTAVQKQRIEVVKANDICPAHLERYHTSNRRKNPAISVRITLLGRWEGIVLETPSLPQQLRGLRRILVLNDNDD
jgi:hypothetical protein